LLIIFSFQINQLPRPDNPARIGRWLEHNLR
jgi:hypothetical protein